MKLSYFIAPLLVAAVSANDKKKADFKPTAQHQILETCQQATISTKSETPSWEGVPRDFGLTEDQQKDIIASVQTRNRMKYESKSEKEILDLAALAEKFSDKKLVEKFEKVIKVIKKDHNMMPVM